MMPAIGTPVAANTSLGASLILSSLTLSMSVYLLETEHILHAR